MFSPQHAIEDCSPIQGLIPCLGLQGRCQVADPVAPCKPLLYRCLAWKVPDGLVQSVQPSATPPEKSAGWHTGPAVPDHLRVAANFRYAQHALHAEKHHHVRAGDFQHCTSSTLWL